jgi:Fungal specific transcription factor domain
MMQCNRCYPCNHCTRRRQPELCAYTTPEESTFERDEKPAKILKTTLRRPKKDCATKYLESVKATVQEGEETFSPLPLNAEQKGDEIVHFKDDSLMSCLGYLPHGRSSMARLLRKFGLLNGNSGGTHARIHGTLDLDIEFQQQLQLDALLAQLPTRPVLNCLVQIFFKDVNWIAEMIHPATFLTRYEKWCHATACRYASSPAASSASAVGKSKGDYEIFKAEEGEEGRQEQLEFTLLVLQICSYAAQFLPSPTYVADTICGISIAGIRETCYSLASSISNAISPSPFATRMGIGMEVGPGSGSLTIVQYTYFSASYLLNAGFLRDAWSTLGRAVAVIQELGMHLELPLESPNRQPSPLEAEMRRRAFWNIYTMDYSLSLTLGRMPRIHANFCTIVFPKMRLTPGVICGGDHSDESSDAPDVFSVQLVEACLAKDWSSLVHQTASREGNYNPAAIEELYKRFMEGFVAGLPSAFATSNPNKRWDLRLPKLAHQRQLLRISVFTVLCHLFRPLLHLTATQISAMSAYERDLVASHRGHMVDSAIALLEAVEALHTLMGGKQTRFFAISFYTLEAAVLLVLHLLGSLENYHTVHGESQAERTTCCAGRDGDRVKWRNLIMTPPCSCSRRGSAWSSSSSSSNAALGARVDEIPRKAEISACFIHITKAIERLGMLREVSPIAEVGAHKLQEALSRVETMQASTESDQDYLYRLPIIAAGPSDYNSNLVNAALQQQLTHNFPESCCPLSLDNNGESCGPTLQDPQSQLLPLPSPALTIGTFYDGSMIPSPSSLSPFTYARSVESPEQQENDDSPSFFFDGGFYSGRVDESFVSPWPNAPFGDSLHLDT